jgi:hypothetical protein
MVMTNETETKAGQEDWTPSGQHMWELQTTDGYLGHAQWRKQGAAIAVTRPDGTDLMRKSWGSSAIFPASWPAMFEWLKGRVSSEIAADRAKPPAPAEVAVPPS